MRAFLAAMLLALPAAAETLPGASDPAFTAPFQAALSGDDPTALIDLHAAAEAGNTAALLALPSVSGWLRQGLTFAQRKPLARVNGQPVAEAVIAANPVAALWNMGDPGTDMPALLDRAFALYAAGEAEKGSMLFMTWLNQTGGYDNLPPGFFDQPIPDWAVSLLLRGRLSDVTYAPPLESDTLLVDRLKANDPAAYMALAAFSGLHRPGSVAGDPARVAAIFYAAGIPPSVGAQRMAETVPVLNAIARPDPPLAPAIAEAAIRHFAAEPEFQPLVVACKAECPVTAQACTTAFVATYGHPYGRGSNDQPFVSLISPDDFYATPRGRRVLFRGLVDPAGKDPYTMGLLNSARAIDACLADAIQRAANP